MPTIRYQLKDGSPVPGVTTVVGSNLGWNTNALVYWGWSMGKQGVDYKDIRKKAADSGTICHEMIYHDLHGSKFEGSKYPPELVVSAETGFLNYLEWKDAFKVKPILLEKNLVSEEHKVGGCPDCVAEIKGVLGLVDWKTGKGIYAETIIQLKAYSKLLKECEGVEIQRFDCLQIGKEDARFTHHYWQSLPEEAWEIFLNLKAIHDRKKIVEKML